MNKRLKELLERPFLLHDEISELLDMEEIEYHYYDGEYLYKDTDENGVEDEETGLYLDKWVVIIEGKEYTVLEF